jgi:hypothetical protein
MSEAVRTGSLLMAEVHEKPEDAFHRRHRPKLDGSGLHEPLAGYQQHGVVVNPYPAVKGNRVTPIVAVSNR